jgi:uncharacterized protein (DUF433 family)
MTTIRIDIPDDQAAALKARAAAQGFTLEAWVRNRAADNPSGAIDWSLCPAVESVPGKVSGAWVFKDTRLPVATIFENLEAGSPIEEIMEQFRVSREQINAVLEFAALSLQAPPVESPATNAHPL